MVAAIGESLEQEILHHAQQSPYFSVIIDEATDISVTKSLGIAIQYLDSNNTAVVRSTHAHTTKYNCITMQVCIF